MTSIAQHRQDQLAELLRIDTLRAKLNAICASAKEAHAGHQNGKLGNLAFDVEALCFEITKAAARVHVSASEIACAEYEAAQRQAEQDFAPALERMRDIVAGCDPKVAYLPFAHRSTLQGA